MADNHIADPVGSWGYTTVHSYLENFDPAEELRCIMDTRELRVLFDTIGDEACASIEAFMVKVKRLALQHVWTARLYHRLTVDVLQADLPPYSRRNPLEAALQRIGHDNCVVAWHQSGNDPAHWRVYLNGLGEADYDYTLDEDGNRFLDANDHGGTLEPCTVTLYHSSWEWPPQNDTRPPMTPATAELFDCTNGPCGDYEGAYLAADLEWRDAVTIGDTDYAAGYYCANCIADNLTPDDDE